MTIQTFNTKHLSAKEMGYWRIIRSRSGVLYIKGDPGTCKSAIMRSLAQKLGLRYLDLRLSQLDESDVGVFPIVNEESRNTKTPTFRYGVPSWALEANEHPTLIHFEELNRASLPVRNATLGILNERLVGNLQLKDHVYMVASGNLGEEDGCDVEEFDGAMNGRLVHKKHTYTFADWSKDFGKDNLHSAVHDYLNAHPEEIYKRAESSPAYASHRSWTNLSTYLKTNLEDGFTVQDVLALLQEDGSAYVGPSVTKLLRYIEENSLISIDDILNRYTDVMKQVKGMNRGRISELLQSLRSRKVISLKDNQISNLIGFLDNVDEDEKVAYLIHVLDKEVESTEKAKIPAQLRTLLHTYKAKMSELIDAGQAPQTPVAAPEEKKGKGKKK